MIKLPSSRRKKKKEEKLNLVPIMDAVFIFIFFLLMSANFVKVFEISSDVPIVSDQEPPKPKKDPLALTLTIEDKEIVVSRGVPSRAFKRIPKLGDGKYDLDTLHNLMVDLKKAHLDENSIILEPLADLTYEEIVSIMDAVRLLRNTDEAIFKKNKDGLDEKVKLLFSQILFGNLMS